MSTNCSSLRKRIVHCKTRHTIFYAIGDRLDGVSLNTDSWLRPAYQLQVRFVLHLRVGLAFASCFGLCNPSDRVLKLQQSFVKHLTAGLEITSYQKS